MSHVFSRMRRVYLSIARAHGVYLGPLLAGCGFFGLGLVRGPLMGLDRLLFPELRRVKLERPIVLVGNPRSGTTFLQRYLVAQGFGAGTELSLMICPSLVVERVLRPWLPELERLSPTKYHSESAHATSLGSVEADDAALFFRFLDGFLAWGFLLSFEEQDSLASLDPSVRDTNQRDFAWLEALWRRSLVVHRAQRNVVKLFSAGPRLPKFLERFPDARVLYLARDPVQSIASTLSLLSGPLDRVFGFWSKPEAERQRWARRIYRGLVLSLTRFCEDWTRGNIDRTRVFIVRYERLLDDFEPLMRELCQFLDHPLSPELLASVRATASEQLSYRSKHRYSLEAFGLNVERVHQDCALFYQTFLTG